MTFESFLSADRPDPRTRRAMSWALGLAAAGHAGLLVAAIVHGSWRIDERSAPRIPPVLVVFTPPSPPPPPAAGHSRRTSTRSPNRPRPTALVQPEKVQAEPPTATSDGAPDDGVPDGQQDGVRDGVLDGTGTAPVARPGHFVPPKVASGQLAIDPQADRYRVQLPPALARAGMRHWALVKLCVTSEGNVHQVDILRGADPTLDPLIVAALRRWRYRPYAVDGRPVPFCTNVRYEITTH